MFKIKGFLLFILIVFTIPGYADDNNPEPEGVHYSKGIMFLYFYKQHFQNACISFW